MTRTANDIAAHESLLRAGFVGRCRTSSIKSAGLMSSLWAAVDCGLARYDGAVTHGRAAVTYFYIYG